MMDCIVEYGWAISLYGAFWVVLGFVVGLNARRLR